MIEIFLIVIVLSVILFLLLFLFIFYKKSVSLERKRLELEQSKRSQSAKYGALTEQWIPFSKEFPYSAEQFRFIGKPIDGIVFDADEIIFVEFKTASSQLSAEQKRIKELVEGGKVSWREFRIW